MKLKNMKLKNYRCFKTAALDFDKHITLIVGKNGAGKSTLMKCLFGINKMDAGEVYLDGQKIEVNNPDEAMKYGIAMVHQ